jgi:lipopolysaccharide transport system ATP-binding protein
MSKKDIILKVENISKQYRLGTVGTGTLSHDLNRWWHAVRGKEDPYLKVGETNDRSSKGTSEYVWALQHINFEVERGEVLGIVGKNGAGKSTLLKILSKVTAPTTGVIKSRGRIASLLEVGTGFNPELTGRENIYLNGAILGMTKKEITSKLDEIIAFSGCERYVDTPTKRYSSGMTVRLAFAVAAFLEPEILVVDEVLAVGDAEFQKKAIGKMQDISREGGRTVLFVSHNMAAVRSLCTRGILMEQGQIKFNGAIDEVIDLYLESASNENSLASYRNSTSQKSTYVSSIELFSAEGKVMNKAFLMGDRIQLKMFVKNNQVLKNLLSSVLIKTITGTRVCAIRTKEMLNERLVANGDFCLTIDNINENLMPGIYTLTFSLGNDSDTFEIIEDCMNFEIVANDVYNTSKIPKGNFVIFSKSSWTLSETNE